MCVDVDADGVGTGSDVLLYTCDDGLHRAVCHGELGCEGATRFSSRGMRFPERKSSCGSSKSGTSSLAMTPSDRSTSSKEGRVAGSVAQLQIIVSAHCRINGV